MCGVGGVVRPLEGATVDELTLRRMAAALRHRGPDGFGFALGDRVGFVSARLAIVDRAGGWQPMVSQPGGSLLVYNGEVYNAPQLRERLVDAGVSCRGRSDTEVVLQLLANFGTRALDWLNGQFAIAWWEPWRRRLTLVRDRFGVRPLYYTFRDDGTLVFGSEAKALFASGEVSPAPDLLGVDEVFTLWGVRAPRTVFRDVRQVRPGGMVVWQDGRLGDDELWWTPEMDPPSRDGGDDPAELRSLLDDSVRLRLRADVPVGTYLSGGLDSSVVTALAARAVSEDLHTFSVAFNDPAFDERDHQQRVASVLGTRHHVVDVADADITAAFRDVIRHVEAPIVRTGCVPMYLMAREARACGITVVATGEGADELFWGYDLFKEAVARRAALRDPSQEAQLDGLYSYLMPESGRRAPLGWRRFFLDAGSADDPVFSHQTRARATAAVKALYAPDVAATLSADDPLDRLRADLPPAFARWTTLQRASYLELTTLLEPYLLAAQGDRPAMAFGVEARYPFLDHRIFDYAVRLPSHRKLGDDGRDKVALREIATSMLPRAIWDRPKRPYRAPELSPFFGQGPRSDWIADALSTSALDSAGIFAPDRVAALLERCRSGRVVSARVSSMLVAVLSTQIWLDAFCRSGTQRNDVENRVPMVCLHLDDWDKKEGVA
jgi:asparagine synthase (glutamine-hydrolysing)